jgi:DnaK suppressor protein
MSSPATRAVDAFYGELPRLRCFTPVPSRGVFPARPQSVLQAFLRSRLVSLADDVLGAMSADPVRRELLTTLQLPGLSAADVRMLARIADALRRVDLGTYGLCISCGRQIHEQHLLEDPTRALCTSCVGRDSE